MIIPLLHKAVTYIDNNSDDALDSDNNDDDDNGDDDDDRCLKIFSIFKRT